MTIDTNIIIAYLAGEKTIIDFLTNWRKRGGFLYIPTIVEAELLSFSRWSDEEVREAQVFIEENFISIPFHRDISRLAAKLRRMTSIKLPDAAIAASALFTKTPLLTRNQRDFKTVKGLQLIVT